MIAKLIVRGADRPRALRAMEQALAGWQSSGLPTNVPQHGQTAAWSNCRGPWLMGPRNSPIPPRRTMQVPFLRRICATEAFAKGDVLQHRQSGRLGSATAGHRGLLGLHPKA